MTIRRLQTRPLIFNPIPMNIIRINDNLFVRHNIPHVIYNFIADIFLVIIVKHQSNDDFIICRSDLCLFDFFKVGYLIINLSGRLVYIRISKIFMLPFCSVRVPLVTMRIIALVFICLRLLPFLLSLSVS